MSEPKTTLPSSRIKNGKKVETKKVNNILKHIPTDTISELNEIIYAGVKVVLEEISISLRNQNIKTKPRWEMRLEGLIKKL